MKKRTENISWDNFFLGVAFLSSFRSKDPNTQVGACIVDNKQRIIATGYNGTVNGFSDDKVLWNNNDSTEGGNKYSYIVDAEINAIINVKGGADKNGATIYVTHYPCNNCLKTILQSGIRRIFYCYTKHPQHLSNLGSRRLIETLGVTVKKLEFPANYLLSKKLTV